MAQTNELKATVRERVGKGAARGMRRTGLVPAVIYGAKRDPEPINLPYAEVWKQFQRGRFLTTVFTVEVGGARQQVIPRAVQLDPVRDVLLHVDFQRVTKDSAIRVGIPVVFRNHDKSPGLKRGGVLNIVRHEVELYCPVDGIPESIVVNLEGLEIGDSVHISHVSLPANTKPVIQDRDFTIATVAGASAKSEEEETAAAAAAATSAEGEGAAAAGAAPAGKDDKEKDAKKKG